MPWGALISCRGTKLNCTAGSAPIAEEQQREKAGPSACGPALPVPVVANGTLGAPPTLSGTLLSQSIEEELG